MTKMDLLKKQILFIIKNQPIKISDLKVNFNNIPQGTLKSDLKYLKVEKFILMIGKGKGSFYILNKENASNNKFFET